MHSTDAVFLEAAGVADRPPMARAIAATARVAPDWFARQLEFDPSRLVFIDESVLQRHGRSSA